jgi:NTP pyrophosphatase (non-canonical NTP hydrolase)
MGDVGDLAKLVQAKEGIREIANVDEKLAHELADCLWCVLVLANKYHIDLEGAFPRRWMDCRRVFSKRWKVENKSNLCVNLPWNLTASMFLSLQLRERWWDQELLKNIVIFYR